MLTICLRVSRIELLWKATIPRYTILFFNSDLFLRHTDFQCQIQPINKPFQLKLSLEFLNTSATILSTSFRLPSTAHLIPFCIPLSLKSTSTSPSHASFISLSTRFVVNQRQLFKLREDNLGREARCVMIVSE
jgi:hypothetical protein